MTSKGADIGKTRLRYYGSTHRGIHAATNFNTGDVIMQIPQTCLISIGQVINCSVGEAMKEAGFLEDNTLKFKKNNFMAALMLSEIYRARSNPKYESPYDAFIKMMPEDSNDFPICFSEEDIKMLESSPIHEKIISRRDGF
jgi:hypothetical protein